MDIATFDLERKQSLYENEVQFNLTESGLHPNSLADVLSVEELIEISKLPLGYGHTDGDPALKQAIASLYEGREAANVIITNGSAEANFVTMWALLQPGDEIVYMVPNYLQIAGIARTLGITVRDWPLRETDEGHWAADIEALSSLVNERTRMIAVCHPNNPTGAVIAADDMHAIAQIAAQHNCYIHSDEIYRGSELNGVECPSFADVYDQTNVVSGLSKSLGFPGLRIGWLLAPQEVIHQARRRHDYTSICASTISQYTAIRILHEDNRTKFLQRGQAHLRHNLQLVQAWIDDINQHCTGPGLSLAPPDAGGMAFVRYHAAIDSEALVDRIRQQHDVFLAAGSWFGMEGYLRIGIGVETAILETGLARITSLILSLLTHSTRRSV